MVLLLQILEDVEQHVEKVARGQNINVKEYTKTQSNNLELVTYLGTKGDLLVRSAPLGINIIPLLPLL